MTTTPHPPRKHRREVRVFFGIPAAHERNVNQNAQTNAGKDARTDRKPTVARFDAERMTRGAHHDRHNR